MARQRSCDSTVTPLVLRFHWASRVIGATDVVQHFTRATFVRTDLEQGFELRSSQALSVCPADV